VRLQVAAARIRVVGPPSVKSLGDFSEKFMPAPKSPSDINPETGYGCLIRLCWMVLGNIALLIAAKMTSNHTGFSISFADVAFWLIVLFLAGIRYFDITRMGGLTVTMNKPATMAHWRRYVLFLVLIGLVLWGIAHAVAFYSS